VSVDGETHPVPQPFTVIATQNTVEKDRAYDLPMAELDRFMKKLHLGYPSEAEETAMLSKVVGHHPIEELSAVATLEDLATARETAAGVTVASHVREYATEIATHTREHAQLGVSPRGSIALLQACQGRAVLDGREYVVPTDVQDEAAVVLTHRIRTEDDRDPADVVTAALDAVEVE
jgi:MoxR-like ATPase